MPIAVHDAEPQREFGDVIPDGTFVRVIMHITPGGADLPSGDPAQDQMDAGLFKASQSSDAIGLDMDIAVIWPPHFAKRKIFGDTFWTVAGGSVDSKGASKGWGLTKSRIRAAINSCTGIDPADKSTPATAVQTIAGFKELDGLEFFARLSVVPGDAAPNGGTYPDKNGLYHIVEPNEPEWALLKQGQEVEPQPVNLKPRGRPATAGGSLAGAAAAPAGWGGAPAGQPPAARTWGVPMTANPNAGTVVPPPAQPPVTNGAATAAVVQAAQPAAPAPSVQRPRWAGGA